MKRLYGWETDSWDCYFWFVGWDYFSLGFHVCLGLPNIEIHLPFGFICIGRSQYKPLFPKIRKPLSTCEDDEDEECMSYLPTDADIVEIDYTNWKGNRRWRKVRPLNIVFGASQYHPGHQWFLQAQDLEEEDGSQPIKFFPMNSIHGWKGQVHALSFGDSGSSPE